jgi:hypothetical protein
MIYTYEGEFPSLTLPQSRWLDMSAGNFIIMWVSSFINVAPPFLDLRINIYNYIYVRSEIINGLRDIVK